MSKTNPAKSARNLRVIFHKNFTFRSHISAAWLVYSHVWPLSSHRCRPINWNWTQIKLNSSLLETNDSGSKYLSMLPFELHGVKTNPTKSARNLGVIFDNNFTFRSHISVACSSCFYNMRDLRRIRRCLDLDSAKLLATALVSSRLDYCNFSFVWYCWHWPHKVSTCSESTGPPGDKVSSIYSRYSTASFSSLVASKV